MKAVTIRVNDVEGVGGFVLPGDRVDVVLTRQIDKGTATTEVVLQNTRVLGDRPDRRRARRQGGGRQIGDARGRARRRRRSCGSRPRSAACRCCCARPAKPPTVQDAQDHVEGFGVRRRRGTTRSTTTTVVVTRADREAGIHRAGRGDGGLRRRSRAQAAWPVTAKKPGRTGVCVVNNNKDRMPRASAGGARQAERAGELGA